MPLHYQTISNELKEIIQTVCKTTFFDKFRLFGGTALALQVGHRISTDADFISEEPFDRNDLIFEIKKLFKHKVQNIRQNNVGVYMEINSIKVDFVSWNNRFIRGAVVMDDMRLMHKTEIVATKLNAVLNRGEKKDYIDIAVMLSELSLQEMFNLFREKYGFVDEMQVIKYLCSYSDIDFQGMPNMLIDFDWEKAKQVIKQTVEKYN